MTDASPCHPPTARVRPKKPFVANSFQQPAILMPRPCAPAQESEPILPLVPSAIRDVPSLRLGMASARMTVFTPTAKSSTVLLCHLTATTRRLTSTTALLALELSLFCQRSVYPDSCVLPMLMVHPTAAAPDVHVR